MKKRIQLIILVIVVLIVCLAKEENLIAQNSPVVSRGNLIMETEEIKFYSGDIRYLKAEIDKLKNECN